MFAGKQAHIVEIPLIRHNKSHERVSLLHEENEEALSEQLRADNDDLTIESKELLEIFEYTLLLSFLSLLFSSTDFSNSSFSELAKWK
jgi:hypothetical protein